MGTLAGLEPTLVASCFDVFVDSQQKVLVRSETTEDYFYDQRRLTTIWDG